MKHRPNVKLFLHVDVNSIIFNAVKKGKDGCKLNVKNNALEMFCPISSLNVSIQLQALKK